MLILVKGNYTRAVTKANDRHIGYGKRGTTNYIIFAKTSLIAECLIPLLEELLHEIEINLFFLS